MAALVQYDVSGGTATITLDSPANRNALSSGLVAELADALTAADADHAVRAVVLTGAGRAFCSGADLAEAAAGVVPVVSLPDVLKLLDAARTPVVCRVNGAARAGGIGLLAACDLVVAPDDVTFSFSEVRLGLAPAIIAVPVLRRVAPAAALELFLTGDTFDASRAAAVGLVNRAVPRDSLDAATEEVVRALLRGGPEALAVTRALVREVPALPYAEALDRMAAVSKERFTSAEAAEGMGAFLEKRTPAWVPGGED